RYRQIVAVIEARREVGRSLGLSDIDPTCDTALLRLAARFPSFAKHADESALMEPMDQVVASVALTALQSRHNMELAGLASLRVQTESVQQAAATGPLDVTLKWSRPGQAIDPTLTLPSARAAAPPERRS